LEKYDVVIVGAGPAGLACAKELSKGNNSVLIIEKNKVIGPKVCAGGLTEKSVEILKKEWKLNSKGMFKLLPMKKYRDILFKSDQKTILISSKKHTVCVIDRGYFGNFLLHQIDKKKVRILKGLRVKNITNSYVELSDERKIGYNFLVGADGSNSLVREYLGIKSEVDITLQYKIKKSNLIRSKKKFRYLEVHSNTKLFGSWYAWIFPYKDYVSVGCGSNPKIMPPARLRQNFSTWLKSEGIDVLDSQLESFPISCKYLGWRFDKVFLCGDACGLASGMSGEGIYQALVSGSEIAKVILEKDYEPKLLFEIIEKNKKAYMIAKFFGKHRLLFCLAKNFTLSLVGFKLVRRYMKKKLLS
jgi:geranylgeranyl reductase